MRNKNLILGTLAFFVLFTLTVAPTRAHSPTDMTLNYDYSNQILTVTVIHAVSDVNTHYIAQIIINKNGQFEMDRYYTSQTSTSSMSDTFNINAVNNDVLQVTAICSVSGQITRQITVSSGGLQTQPGPDLPGFPALAIGIGIVCALGIFGFRKRKLSAK